jgi:hypothetical protein
MEAVLRCLNNLRSIREKSDKLSNELGSTSQSVLKILSRGINKLKDQLVKEDPRFRISFSFEKIEDQIQEENTKSDRDTLDSIEKTLKETVFEIRKAIKEEICLLHTKDKLHVNFLFAKEKWNQALLIHDEYNSYTLNVLDGVNVETTLA